MTALSVLSAQTLSLAGAMPIRPPPRPVVGKGFHRWVAGSNRTGLPSALRTPYTPIAEAAMSVSSTPSNSWRSGISGAEHASSLRTVVSNGLAARIFAAQSTGATDASTSLYRWRLVWVKVSSCSGMNRQRSSLVGLVVTL